MKLLLQTRDFFFYSLKHPKVKIAVVSALSFLVLDLLVFAGFWLPTAYHHHQLVQKIEKYRQAQLEAGRARETAQRSGQLEKRVKTLEAKWEEPVTQSALIESLNRLASRNGLRVVSQDFDAETTQGNGKALKQNLSLSGTYQALRHFFSELENLKTLTVVEEARLERVGEEGAQVRAVLKLCTYNRPATGKRF